MALRSAVRCSARVPLRSALEGAVGILTLTVAFARPATAQDTLPTLAVRTLTRGAAIDLALSHGAQAALAAATARAGDAALARARSVANPTVNTSYSKAVPQYHAIVDLPLDFLTARSLRVAVARSTAAASHQQLALDRALVAWVVDTLYTHAAMTAAHATLSHRDAVDADSLRSLAAVRRDAGDASDLDLELARVNAGQADNLAASDSLARIADLIELQSALGLLPDSVRIALADTSIDSGNWRALPPGTPGRHDSAGTPLAVAVAERELEAADRSVALERRSLWNSLSLTAGVEGHDPTGAERGVLPTVGLSFPLPILNRSQGDVAVARAERDRAQATLALVRRETALAVLDAERTSRSAVDRLRRDRMLVSSADRVVRMALQAYAEGAYPLASVLEAQHNARTVLAQLIDDTGAAANAAAALRFYTTPAVNP